MELRQLVSIFREDIKVNIENNTYLLSGSQSSSIDVSPIKLKRSRVVANYIKSPSPKKRKKEENCYFCHLNFETAQSLEQHLKQSPRCCQNYLKNFKMKSLEPIMVTQYPCYFCRIQNKIRLGVHLRKSCNCRQQYFNKFNVTSLEALLPIIANLRRQMSNSRTKTSRKEENERRKLKKLEIKTAKSGIELRNNFRRDITYSKAKLCYKCNLFINNGKMMTDDDVSMDLAEFDPQEVLKLRRFQAYYCCQDCLNKKTTNSEPKIAIQSLPVEDKTIFAPSALFTQNVDLNQSSSHHETTSTIVCIFPATLEALHHMPTDAVKCRSGDAGIIYRLNPNIENIFAIAYENELHKFKVAKYFGDRFQGSLKEGHDKSLASVSRVAQDHLIVGSDSWARVERDINFRRMDQNGTICFWVSVSMPIQQDVLASSLIQSGLVLSVEYVGSSTSELHTKYFVHNHGPDVDCNESCVKERLENYLPGVLDMNSIGQKFLGIHLASVQNKMKSFIRHFLKDQDSEIYSEEYSFRIDYKLTGEIKLTGYFWAKELENINLEYPKYPVSEVDSQVISDTIKYIDSQISTSTKAVVLQNQFNFSKLESENLAELALRLQHHHCGQDNCKICSAARLPAIETDFTFYPEPKYFQNIATAQEFRDIMLNKLKAASTEEYAMETVEWLKHVFEGCELNVREEGMWTLKIENVMLYLLLDKRLLDLAKADPENPFIGIYKYCLTCKSLGESFQVVIKTVALIDSYTKPYHKDLLRSFEAEMEISPGNGYCKQQDLDCEYDDNLEVENICENLTLSHRAVSLGEVFSALDKNIQRTANSTSSEYISARADRKTYFKKVQTENENTFTAEGTSGYFEKQNSNIEKYFNRKNAAHVTLAEFCMHFDYVGSEESRQFMKLFSKKEVSINDSEKRSAMDPSRFLPELILTNNNEVLKIRTVRKIITFPEFEELSKHRYQRVLMFFPLTAEPKNDEEVLALFNTRVGENDDEHEEEEQTIVDRNER